MASEMGRLRGGGTEGISISMASSPRRREERREDARGGGEGEGEGDDDGDEEEEISHEKEESEELSELSFSTQCVDFLLTIFLL